MSSFFDSQKKIFGILIIIIGLVFFLIPISNDRPEVDRWSGFDIVRQENVTLSSLSFNIVTLEETQNLHIYYSTNEISGETPFLMFMIPYLGTLVNPQGDKYSIPGEWQTYQDLGLKTTILYKFFDCTEKKYCYEQLNMYFDFDYKIDSKQYYTHSINIPFMAPHDSPLNDARNKIFNIGTNEEITIRELILVLEKIHGQPIKPSYTEFHKAGTKRRLPDISKITQLGYHPKIPLTDGLKKTYEWYFDYYKSH